MLVDLKRPLIYVKPKKCASTSVEVGLDWLLWGVSNNPADYEEERFFSRRPSGFVTHLRHNQDRWTLTPEDQGRGFANPAQLMSYRARSTFRVSLDLMAAGIPHPWRSARAIVRRFQPHTSVTTIRRVMGEDFWSRAFKVTVVRNPWDTVVSDYYWSTRHLDPFERNFDDFASSYTIPPPQKEIADFADEFDVILRLETLDADFAELARRLERGGSEIALPRYKSQTRPAERKNYRELFTPHSQRHVAEVFATYIEKFDYEF